MEEMGDIIKDFIGEAKELLQGLDQKLVELEKTPRDKGLLDSIFRAVHTIKGSAGFLGLDRIVEVSHKTENVLNRLRQGHLALTPEIMDALLRAIDMVRLLLAQVERGDESEVDITPVIKLLEATLVEAQTGKDPAADGEQVQRTPDAQTPLPGIIKEEADTIRVETKRLDNLLNLVGELVLGRNRILRLAAQLEDRYGEDGLVEGLKKSAYNLDLITNDLQLAIMKVRMQPIARVFNRFPRMVRDLARAQGKEVKLILKGEETELDKTVIEEINDPLVHLVRNAIDHGIEPPDERLERGKSPVGVLSLSAYQQGDNILVTVEDDGRGIDLDKIREKALEKNLLGQEDLERLNERELLNLIFYPGFTTVETVTDLSGRGIGMDVVRNNVTRLNGSIDISTAPGRGTRISLRLPLTLAIIQVLRVGAGEEDYALPLSNVKEIRRIDQDLIWTVDGREVIYSRDHVYPLLRLSELLDIQSSMGGKGYAVILSLGERQIALLVDELLGEEEVVIKSMGSFLTDLNGIAGATITGDGKVVLILDVVGLINRVTV